jgi:hypothetical protein
VFCLIILFYFIFAKKAVKPREMWFWSFAVFDKLIIDSGVLNFSGRKSWHKWYFTGFGV